MDANDRQMPAGMDHRELEGLTRELARGGISRRQFLVRALGLGLSVSAAGSVLAACGGGGGENPSSASPAPMDTTKPEKFALYNWADYLAPSVKKSFEETTGIQVVETYFDDNEAMYAKLQAGASGYDAAITAPYMVSIMIKAGIIQPMDLSFVPNFKNVEPAFQTLEADPGTNGVKYSTPYQWGTTGIGVRLDKVSQLVTSWNVMWDPAYKKQITMSNEMRETMGASLFRLGYSQNSTSESELDEATAALIEQKPLVLQYDNNNMKRNMLTGVPLVHAWNADAVVVMKELGEDKLAYALPDEGFAMWMDCVVIPNGANSPYAAHLFADFVLDPQQAADMIDYTWYCSPVPAAYDLIKNRYLKKAIPTEEQLQNGELLNDLGEFQQYYADCWRRVKSA